MFLKRRYLSWSAAGLVLWGSFAHAGDFSPPAEGPVAFRRDKIPLDPDAMTGLSKNLETLARGMDAGTAAERRGAAQMIALSLALDPSNGRVRDLIREFESGGRKADADPVLLEKSRARIWQLAGWLESPEAGSQGQSLAACLKDVIAIADPKNPKSPPIKEAGEKGAWAGWVPALAAYETPAIAKATPSGNPLDGMPAPVDPSPVPSGLKLEKAKVATLLWRNTGSSDSPLWKLAVGQMEMTAAKEADHAAGSEHAGTQPLVVQFGTTGENNPLNQISGTIRNLLRKRHPKETHGVTITIDSPDLRAALQSNKRHSISAAAAILADSAFSGADPDALVIGSVDENGSLKLPSGFWDLIRALPRSKGQRLILPAEAAAYLPAMLAFEKPEFFLDYDVILAADFDQMCAFSAKTIDGPAGAAITEFNTIRERLGSQDVRQYISNSFVKQRFNSVLQNLPTDFSSRMLLVQASGNRPTTVSRPVLATEIRRALDPMEDLIRNQDKELQPSETAKLSQLFETCRTGVDSLERYAAKSDVSLLTEARDLVNLIRSLEKATRTRGESYVVTAAVNSARGDLARAAKLLADKLATEMGEPAPTGSR